MAEEIDGRLHTMKGGAKGLVILGGDGGGTERTMELTPARAERSGEAKPTAIDGRFFDRGTDERRQGRCSKYHFPLCRGQYMGWTYC